MSGNRKLLGGVITLTIGLVVVLWFAWPGHAEETVYFAPTGDTSTIAGLGMTYLAIQPSVTAHYNLGVDSGALITKVDNGGLAQRAGLREGDVIVSYNRVRLEDGVPLLGVMRRCHAGSRVEVEIVRDGQPLNLSFVHTVR